LDEEEEEAERTDVYAPLGLLERAALVADALTVIGTGVLVLFRSPLAQCEST